MLFKKIWPAAFLLVVALAVGVGVWWWLYAPVTTDYTTVKKGDAIETLLATGKVVGESTIPLSFSQAGIVTEVFVQEGERVEKGQILIALESSKAANMVLQRENALARAKINLERLQKDEVARAWEALRQAELQYLHAEDNYERNIELFREGIISNTELEQTEHALEQAASNQTLANIALQGLQDTSLRLARLEIEQAAVVLDEAKLQYEAAMLRPPLTGTVIRTAVSQGEYVQPGQALLQLVPETEFTYVEVEVDEDLSGKVITGQQAIITTSAFSEKEYKGQVSRVAPSIDAARGTFAVRLTLDEQVPILLPDQAVFAEIITGRRQDVLILEQRFLFREGDSKFVYTMENEQARLRELVTEDLGNGRVAVLQGLEEGEMILTALELRDGQRIRLLQERE